MNSEWDFCLWFAEACFALNLRCWPGMQNQVINSIKLIEKEAPGWEQCGWLTYQKCPLEVGLYWTEHKLSHDGSNGGQDEGTTENSCCRDWVRQRHRLCRNAWWPWIFWNKFMSMTPVGMEDYDFIPLPEWFYTNMSKCVVLYDRRTNVHSILH